MTADLSIAHPSLHADSDFWNDPYPFYDKLRSIDPVYKGTVLKYPGWYVTGYKEAAPILKDTRFKNRIPLPEASTKYQNLSHIQHDMLLFKNQSDHKRMRMLIGKEFTAKTAESLRPCIKETVHDLLDQVQIKKNRGSCFRICISIGKPYHCGDTRSAERGEISIQTMDGRRHSGH